MANIRNFDSFGGCIPTFLPDKRELWHEERTFEDPLLRISRLSGQRVAPLRGENEFLDH